MKAIGAQQHTEGLASEAEPPVRLHYPPWLAEEHSCESCLPNRDLDLFLPVNLRSFPKHWFFGPARGGRPPHGRQPAGAESGFPAEKQREPLHVVEM